MSVCTEVLSIHFLQNTPCHSTGCVFLVRVSVSPGSLRQSSTAGEKDQMMGCFVVPRLPSIEGDRYETCLHVNWPRQLTIFLWGAFTLATVTVVVKVPVSAKTEEPGRTPGSSS